MAIYNVTELRAIQVSHLHFSANVQLEYYVDNYNQS